MWSLENKIYKNFASVMDDPFDFKIQSFEQIGVADPYPNERMGRDDFYDPATQGNLMFLERRFQPHSSPIALYIPSRPVLFKIMRACICAEGPDELWFRRQ